MAEELPLPPLINGQVKSNRNKSNNNVSPETNLNVESSDSEEDTSTMVTTRKGTKESSKSTKKAPKPIQSTPDHDKDYIKKIKKLEAELAAAKAKAKAQPKAAVPTCGKLTKEQLKSSINEGKAANVKKYCQDLWRTTKFIKNEKDLEKTTWKLLNAFSDKLDLANAHLDENSDEYKKIAQEQNQFVMIYKETVKTEINEKRNYTQVCNLFADASQRSRHLINWLLMLLQFWQVRARDVCFAFQKNAPKEAEEWVWPIDMAPLPPDNSSDAENQNEEVPNAEQEDQNGDATQPAGNEVPRRLPPFVALKKIVMRDLAVPDDDPRLTNLGEGEDKAEKKKALEAQNKAMFVWYVTEYLPCFALHQFYGVEKHHKGCVSYLKLPQAKDDKALCVPPSTEAFALVAYDNCRDRWEALMKWKLDPANQDKKGGMPKYCKNQTETHNLKGKYSDGAKGQARFGGWTKEGRDLFKGLMKEIADNRKNNKAKIEELEKEIVNAALGKKGKKRPAEDDDDEHPSKKAALEEEDSGDEDELGEEYDEV